MNWLLVVSKRSKLKGWFVRGQYLAALGESEDLDLAACEFHSIPLVLSAILNQTYGDSLMYVTVADVAK